MKNKSIKSLFALAGLCLILSCAPEEQAENNDKVTKTAEEKVVIQETAEEKAIKAALAIPKEKRSDYENGLVASNLFDRKKIADMHTQIVKLKTTYSSAISNKSKADYDEAYKMGTKTYEGIMFGVENIQQKTHPAHPCYKAAGLVNMSQRGLWAASFYKGQSDSIKEDAERDAREADKFISACEAAVKSKPIVIKSESGA